MILLITSSRRSNIWKLNLLFMEAWTAAKKTQLLWRCHQLLSGFLGKGHLPRVPRQSRRSLMIRVIMKWSWGLCTDLLAFALQLRKIPENLSWRTVYMKGLCNQSSPQMGSLSSKWGRYDRTARQEGKGKVVMNRFGDPHGMSVRRVYLTLTFQLLSQSSHSFSSNFG